MLRGLRGTGSSRRLLPAAGGTAPARAYAITTPSREGRTPSPLIQPSDADGEDPSGRNAKEFKGAVNYFPDFIHAWNKEKFMVLGGALAAGSLASFAAHPALGVTTSVVTAGYWYLGLQDLKQTRHTIRRNFPVLGHMRYIFEQLRPEIYQYFVESDQSGVPFNREKRGMAYQRAKNIDATMPFGTKMDVYGEGYEWLNHSLWPQHIDVESSRTMVGGPSCTKPYSAALLNVSAMSYGALSDNAILALNTGAKIGGFYHNTGEGGMSRFHLEPGADLVWNIGTGYFGCGQSVNGVRTFDPEMFRDNAQRDNCKMIEIKLSQGAKPAHGGMLPKEKITPAIAEARGLGLPPYEDCNSPPRHSAFATPYELAEFVTTLRELSGGKPVGMKLCVGRPEEVAALIRAFYEFGPEAAPDFITVDGAEGGTGAAPPEFSNRVGMPLHEGLTVVKGLLRGAGFRTTGSAGHNGHPVKIISSGRVVNGFDLVRLLALGADICNSARAMMFALGCIQALMCNTNKCPTGIATSKPHLMAGLDVDDKAVRVAQFQAKTVHTALEIIGACGLDKAHQIGTEHIWRRVDGFSAKSFRDMYAEVPIGSLTDGVTGREGRKKPVFEKWWDAGGGLLNKSHAIGASSPIARK
eukprot:g4691.t1